MNTLQKRSTALKFIFALCVLGLLFSPFTNTYAQTKTTADLQKQIEQLIAQLSAVQAQVVGLNKTTGVNFAFNRDFTLGSSGTDVVSLQKFLISKGYGIPAGATGYFGYQTKEALSSFQRAKGINPSLGYFGPMTRGYINSSTSVVSPSPSPENDGDKEEEPKPKSKNTLQGDSGSVSEYRLTPGYNNEEVGENQKDVEVAGIDIKVDNGSDIRLTSLTIVFDEDTATKRFDRYADKVSIWLDGEEIARVDASVFTKSNNWTKNISLKGDTIIKRKGTGRLTLAISGARTIDSANLGHSWTVDFRSIRFTDAEGSSISEDPNTGTRTFSFESFSSASGAKFKISENDESVNNPHVINVHATNKTRDISVLSFDVKVEGSSDIKLDSIPVEFSVTGATHLDEMVSAIHLYVDGKRVSTKNVPTDEETVVFNNLDLLLRANKSSNFVVKVDFLPLSGLLDEGDTISASIGETETSSSQFNAEDASGKDLTDSAKTGSASGGAHIVYDTGVITTFMSSTQSVAGTSGADNDSGTFTIKYKVQAFDGTVYVSTSPTATSTSQITDQSVDTNGVIYYVDKAGTAVTDNLSAFVSWKKIKGNPTSSSNRVRLNDGDIVEFTLSVVRTNNGDPSDDGIYHVLLKAIGWNTDNTTTFNVYDFDLGSYKTDPVYLN